MEWIQFECRYEIRMYIQAIEYGDFHVKVNGFQTIN